MACSSDVNVFIVVRHYLQLTDANLGRVRKYSHPITNHTRRWTFHMFRVVINNLTLLRCSDFLPKVLTNSSQVLVKWIVRWQWWQSWLTVKRNHWIASCFGRSKREYRWGLIILLSTLQLLLPTFAWPINQIDKIKLTVSQEFGKTRRRVPVHDNEDREAIQKERIKRDVERTRRVVRTRLKDWTWRRWCACS